MYLEKPPVPLIQQLEELIALDVRKRVAVGFQLVNSSAVQQLKLWRLQDALGQIENIRVCGCSPRSPDYYARTPWAGKMIFDGKAVFDGPATNALSHWLHNIMYLGAPRADEFDTPTTIQGELYRAKQIESYDTVCLRGRLESGVGFHYAVTHAAQESLPCCLEVIGSRGRAWAIENRASAENDSGLSATVALSADPLLKMWREFVLFARGKKPRATTNLEDARGYVLATNAALVSSDGIHRINSTVNLVDLIKSSAKRDKLFLEVDVPWKQKSALIKTRRLSSLNITKYADSIE